MKFKVKRIPLVPMQKAIYKHLTSYQTTPVYDHIPDGSVQLPYITLGAATFKPGGAKDRDIYACSIQLHVWSEYEGKAEVNFIMNDVATILTAAPLDMTEDNYSIMSSEMSFFEAYEADPYGYHGVITFDLKIEDMEV